MKYILVIGDGIADRPLPALRGRTPLASSPMPMVHEMARTARIGRALTVPEGLEPGSDTAILSIFGYDPRTYFSGRSPLEAAGSGVNLDEGNVSFRLNLVTLEGEGPLESRVIVSHNGSGISGADGEALARALMEDSRTRAALDQLNMTIHPLPSFRHIGVMDSAEGSFAFTPPHDIPGKNIAEYLPGGDYGARMRALMAAALEVLEEHPINIRRAREGKGMANCLWPWGQGHKIELPPFKEKYGHYGSVITAVPLVKGIARLAGLKAPEIEGATGELNTNYRGKVEAALAALAGGDDFVCVHVEAPDEMSHNGDLRAKLQAIDDIDVKVLAPLVAGMREIGDFRLLYMSDHATPVALRIHTGEPVPFLIYDSARDFGGGVFTEKGAENGPLVENGSELIGQFFTM